MARGWESKSVEAQQSEALEEAGQSKPRLTAEERIKFQKRQGLLLDRQRVLGQLEKVSNPQFRSMLQAALADLNRKIEALG